MIECLATSEEMVCNMKTLAHMWVNDKFSCFIARRVWVLNSRLGALYVFFLVL